MRVPSDVVARALETIGTFAEFGAKYYEQNRPEDAASYFEGAERQLRALRDYCKASAEISCLTSAD